MHTFLHAIPHRRTAIVHTSMDCLINNKDNWSKLWDDSLTTTRRSRRAGFARSPHVTSFVFCLPLSWLQCCDIYFGVKEFIQHWYSTYFKTQSKNSDPITNIDVKNLNLMIEKIENRMVSGCSIEKEEKNVLKSVLHRVKATLKIVLPCLTKLNNFISFYSSIYRYNHKKRQEYTEKQEEKFRLLLSKGMRRPVMWKYQYSPKTMGATKRIVFMPDMENIYHINQVFSKLQLFVASNISKYGNINNNNNSTTPSDIFCNISPQSSLLKSNCDLKIGTIDSLYDETEKHYIDQLVTNYSNYNKNDNDDKSKNVKCDLTKEQVQRQMTDVANAIFQEMKESSNLHNINHGKKLMFHGIDLNENIDIISQVSENDFKIDYSNWRANSYVEKFYTDGKLVEKVIYYNNYTYHNHHRCSMLNYDVEWDRKKLNYPKMYNIDYDYVDKIYRYRCKEFVIKLKEWQTRNLIYSGRIVELMQRGKPEFDAIIANLAQIDYHGHKYENLSEFYDFGSDEIGGWKRFIPEECKVTRCTQNMHDYDLFKHSDDDNKNNNNYTNDSSNGRNQQLTDYPTALIANMDRMYCIQLDRIIKRWYKTGKYLLYRILPHDDNQETSLSIDFCHFQIYYNRLKLLENAKNLYKLDAQYISKCAWIALNDCSRYCKDEFNRHFQFEQETFGEYSHADELRTLFACDDKGTWDRMNKNKYGTKTQ